MTAALLTFEVPGQPHGKGRHRSVTRRRKGGATYQAQIPHEPSESYEAKAGWLAKAAGARVLEGPLWMHITAFAMVPKSAPKSLRDRVEKGVVYFTTKPDWDNVGKIIGDALNGIAYLDDNQVADGRVIKRYTLGPSRVVVSIGRLEDGTEVCHNAPDLRSFN